MDHELDQLADSLESLRTWEPGGSWFDDVCGLAARTRRTILAETSARDTFDDIIDLAPRLDSAARRIDKRGERIVYLASLLHVLSRGRLRSAEATRVTMYQLTVELRSLAHRRRSVVVDAVTIDIGGTG